MRRLFLWDDKYGYSHRTNSRPVNHDYDEYVSIEEYNAAIAWLNEFVVEPEYFPGEGDRQWWQEKRDSLAKIEEGK